MRLRGLPALSPRAVVVGAGIVGVSAAYFLACEGVAVTLLDPRPPGTGTSFGNAGIISLGSVLPVAAPGLFKAAPRMLRRPGPALRLRWRDLPGLAPWLWGLWRASTPKRAEAASRALSTLIKEAGRSHDLVIQGAGLADLVDRVGWLKAGFTHDAVMRATAADRAAWARCGIAFEILDRAGVAALEPALAPGVRAGVFLPENRAVRLPLAYTEGILRAFAADGGRYSQAEALGFAIEDGRVRAVRTEAGSIPTDLVVLAAGAFSGPLARGLGVRLPLRAERGYHAVLPHPKDTLTRPVLCVEAGFVLAPMRGGLRLTSGVEIGRTDAPADDRWVRGLVPQARRYLPGLDGRIESTWLGHRPTLSDTLPVIGRSRAAANAFLALGHGHIGLTLGPLTGRIVAAMALGLPPPVDPTPFAPARFA